MMIRKLGCHFWILLTNSLAYSNEPAVMQYTDRMDIVGVIQLVGAVVVIQDGDRKVDLWIDGSISSCTPLVLIYQTDHNCSVAIAILQLKYHHSVGQNGSIEWSL